MAFVSALAPALPMSDYHAPISLYAALELLAVRPDALVIAGGTEAVRRLRNEAHASRPIIALSALEELRAIEETSTGRVRVGALATCTDIATSPLIAKHAPLLAEAARSVGGPQIRNCATVGGNIALRCAKSDLLPPLLALDATIILESRGEARRSPLASYLAETARSHELITSIECDPAPRGTCFLRMSSRKSLGPAIVSVAVLLFPAADRTRWERVRIALGGVAHAAMRSRRAEAILSIAPCSGEELMTATAAAAAAAQNDSSPQSDAWASEWYRRHVAGVLVRRAIAAACT